MRPWLAGSWPLKLYYLFFFAAAGVYFPYTALYLQAIHLDGTQIGVISSLAPLAGLLLPPIWGILSDRFGWRQRLLLASLLSAALCSLLAPFASTFFPALLAVLFLSICISPAIPLANAATLEWLHAHGGSFGSIRVFGSFGFLTASLCIGFVYEGRHILWLFPIYGLVLLMTALVGLTMPAQENLVRQDSGIGVRDVLKDRVVVRFLLWCGVGYGAFAAYNTFFSLYLKGLGAGTNVLGLASGLATISELPTMALVGMLMARVGIKPVLLLGLVTSGVRWLAYGLIHDYHLVLVLQPLHGVSFASFYVAGVTFMDQRTPARLRATGQSLFNGVAFGLGVVVESNIFGVLYDRIGASEVFLIASGIAAVAVVMLATTTPRTPLQPPFTKM